MPEIIQKGNNILRKRSEEVKLDEIGSSKLNKIIKDMKEALADQYDGVAIAAIQIGVPLRIFMVAGHVYDHLSPEFGEKIDKSKPSRQPDKVFINPDIIKKSKKIELMDEGCLSVRNYFGEVPRHTKVTIKALDEKGEEFIDGRSGLLAQIFQHEIDHMDGILFVDKARNVGYRGTEESDDV